jgi:hypothetical protein
MTDKSSCNIADVSLKFGARPVKKKQMIHRVVQLWKSACPENLFFLGKECGEGWTVEDVGIVYAQSKHSVKVRRSARGKLNVNV